MTMAKTPINKTNAGVSAVNVDHLRESLEYDATSGELTWRARPERHFKSRRAFNTWNAKYAGRRAFCTSRPNGYFSGTFNGVEMLAHRVAWLLISGKWPEEDVDHIDGVRSNNAAKNLRAVSRTENMRNRGWKGNEAGAMGVYIHKATGLYAARIYEKGKVVSLGYFKTLKDASNARFAAESKLGYHANHGRPL